VPVRRGSDRSADGGHRHHHRRSLHRRQIMTMQSRLDARESGQRADPVVAPYLPFARPTIDEETIAGVAEVLRSGWITTGPKVQEFERALSGYLGGRIVRTFTSATGALEVALQACGIGPGDEVIVPAMTFAASANVVARVGARPVFVDVELDTRNLDPALLEAAITPRTRAIM